MSKQSPWGQDDERGALNRIDESVIRRATQQVVSGRAIALGLPIAAGASPRARMRPEPQLLMLRDGGDYAAGLPERPGYGFADDQLVIACHGTTHLDALSHVWRDGVMWNGRSAESVTSRGASFAGIETTGPIVTRGILVDIADVSDRSGVADYALDPEHLERVLAREDCRPGDAVLIRTGWLRRWRDEGADPALAPGIDSTCVEVLERFGVVLVGADNVAVEVQPSRDPDCALPVHIELIRDRGIFLLELLDLEALAASGATSFMLVVSPLKIVGASGSPVSPTAII